MIFRTVSAIVAVRAVLFVLLFYLLANVFVV